MAEHLTAGEKFARDVPQRLQEDVCMRIGEAMWAQESADGVHLLEIEAINAANYRALGTVTVEGEEYTFIAESGDRNGFQIVDWDDGAEFKPLERTQYALQPVKELINSAIDSGKGPFLVLKWDAMLKRSEIAEIPGKYAYDQYVQPGSLTRDYWRKKAAEYRFEIVDQETADATRKRLMEANSPYTEVRHG